MYAILHPHQHSGSILPVLVFLASAHFTHCNQSSIFKSKSTRVHISHKLKAHPQFPTAHTWKSPDSTKEPSIPSLSFSPTLPHCILGSPLYFWLFYTLCYLVLPPTGSLDMLYVFWSPCFLSCFFWLFPNAGISHSYSAHLSAQNLKRRRGLDWV